MDRLHDRILRFSGLGRRDLISALIRMDAKQYAAATNGARTRGGTNARHRADEAKDKVNRLGKIIHFLRFRFPMPAGPDESICQLLAEKLQAKGDWEGQIPSG
jgi:hypothetical protein